MASTKMKLFLFFSVGKEILPSQRCQNNLMGMCGVQTVNLLQTFTSIWEKKLRERASEREIWVLEQEDREDIYVKKKNSMSL